MQFHILDENYTPVTVMDNDLPDSIKFNNSKFHRFLTGSADFFDFETSKLHVDHKLFQVGYWLAFRYDGRDRLQYINEISEAESDKMMTISSVSSNLDLNNEMKEPFSSTDAKPFKWYFDIIMFDTGYEIGINEISNLTRKLSWESSMTARAFIQSVATQFDNAELDYEVVLNSDFTIKKRLIHIKKKIGEVRDDIELRYGDNVKTVKRTTSISELCTAVRPVSKDDNDKVVNISSLNDWQELDEKGNVKFFHKKGTNLIFAPQANARFGNRGHNVTGGGYIVHDFSYDKVSQNELFNRSHIYLEEHSVPAINYEVEGRTGAKIGDTVKIVDDGYTPPLILSARVLEQVFSFDNASVEQSIFGNYKALQSQISDDLIAKMQQLAEENAPYKAVTLTTNGLTFKNSEGSTKLTARLYKGNKEIVPESYEWTINGIAISENSEQYEITADDIYGKAVVRWSAVINGVTVAFDEVTLTDVSDGTDGISPTVTVNPDTSLTIVDAQGTITTPVLKGDKGDQGIQGLQGPAGTQGIAGPKGADGKTQYTHIAYANSSDGVTDFSTSDSNRTYIGIYVNFNIDDSTTPSDYSWTLVKGADGTQGTPGKPGTDGKTPYFHTAWSYSADGRDRFTTVYPNLNLGDNTKTFVGAEGGNNLSGSIRIDPATQKTQDGDFYYLTAKAPRDNYDWFRLFLIPETVTPNMTKVAVKPNTKYTFSVLLKGTGQHTIYAYQNWTAPNTPWFLQINLTNDWKLYTLTVTSSNVIPDRNVQFFIRSNTGTEINLKYPKVEEGSTATPYMLSSSEVTTADWPSYIGQYTDFTQADSTNPSDYTWSIMRGNDGKDGAIGPKGDPGNQGIPGTPGVDGRTPYTHWAYANSADGALDFNPDYKSAVGLDILNVINWAKNTSMSSSTYKFVSNADSGFKVTGKGTGGYEVLSKSFPAKIGDKLRFTVCYTNRLAFELFNNYGLQFVASGAYTESVTSTSKIVLPNAITASTEYQLEYTATTSNVWMQLNFGGVADNAQVDFNVKIEVENLTNPVKYAYMGTYSDYTATDSAVPADYTWSRILGADGANGTDGIAGKDGNGIKATAITYQASTNGTTAPTGTWSASVPTVAKGSFLWTRTIWTYTDNTTETGYAIAYMGTNGNNGTDGVAGKDGVGIQTTTITYAGSTSGTTEPTSGWTSTVPTVAAGSYLWTKTVWTYTDNSTETGYSVAMMGVKGDKGDKGIKGNDGTDGTSGIIVSSVAPASPQTGQLWQDTSTTPQLVKKWTGSSWVIWELYAQNLKADKLDAISGNLGTMIAGIIKVMADIIINAAGKTKKFGMLLTKKGLLSTGPTFNATGQASDTKMAAASLTQGELRFINMDYNENLEQVQDSGTSSVNNGFIRFSSTAEKGDLLEITSKKILLNGYATQTSPWITLSALAKYRVAFGTVTVAVGLINGSSSNAIHLGSIPVELRPADSRMFGVSAWWVDTSRDRHVQLNADQGNMVLLNPYPNQEYRFEVTWTIPM